MFVGLIKTNMGWGSGDVSTEIQKLASQNLQIRKNLSVNLVQINHVTDEEA